MKRLVRIDANQVISISASFTTTTKKTQHWTSWCSQRHVTIRWQLFASKRIFFIWQPIVGELQCEHSSASIRNAYMSINCSGAAAYYKLKHNRINRKIDKTKTKVPFNLWYSAVVIKHVCVIPQEFRCYIVFLFLDFFSRGYMMMKSTGQEDLLKALPNTTRARAREKEGVKNIRRKSLCVMRIGVAV